MGIRCCKSEEQEQTIENCGNLTINLEQNLIRQTIMLRFTIQDHHVGTATSALVHVIEVGNAPLEIYAFNINKCNMNYYI